MGIFIWFKNKIKGHDLYAKPITLFYKGNQELKSAYGGLISVLIKILIVVFACLLTRVIFTRGGTKKIANKIMYDLANDSTKHYIGKNNFKLAIGFHNFSGGTPKVSIFDETYFNVSVFVSHSKYENGTAVTTREILDHGY